MSTTRCAAALAVLSAALTAQSQFLAPTRPPVATDANPEFKIAVGDVDLDGFPDIVCANMGGTMPGTQNSLYLNDGFGGFVDVTATHLPASVDWTGAVALGDVDFDADLDIFFGNASGQTSTLYLNDGTGHFTDVTATQLPPLARTIYCAKLVDIDHDVDLDLIAREKIFTNNVLGTFTDMTTVLGPSSGAPVNAWGMAVGDVNGDGHVDVMFGINSTSVPPVLWLNDGTGRFTDASANLPGPIYVAGDFDLGDLDGDGDLDVFLQSYARPSQLWFNNGLGVFTDVSGSNLPPLTEYTYTSALADVDLDGDLDIVLINGANVANQTKILRNNGTGVFTVDASAAPIGNMVSTCGAVADLDLDGDPDLVFGNWNTQNAVWLNQHRHCYAPAAPQLGTTWLVDFTSMPGYGPQTAVLPLLSIFPRTTPLSLPGIGVTVIPPATVFSLGVGLTSTTGRFQLSLPVPNNAALHNLPLLLQGLVVEGGGLKLTNTFGDAIL